MQLRAFVGAVAGHRLQTHPYRELLPNANFPTSRAQNRHFCALLPASFFPMAPPASNKPHSAEKSTPLRLAIWRIWAGFANSQLLPDAAAGAPSRALGAESTAERQLFRTDFRFAPSPRRASLAVPPIHEGHGRPRSVRKSSRLRWKHLSAGGGQGSQK